MTPPVLELRGIQKRFGSVHALRGADFVLRAGEIHALLGENGAGKTTLMHVAYGLIRPEAGTVLRDGRPVTVRSPADARALGIGMVHQHFTSVPALTVAENVALATGGVRSSVRAAGDAVLGALWEGLDPDARVEDLSVGLKQRLEIVKALAARARVLLLDEPTAVLTPLEVTELMAAIRRFAELGGSVVLITHKLAEAFDVAESVTVLRHGVTTLTGPLAAETRASLAAAMLGGGGASDQEPRSAAIRSGPGDLVLRLTEVGVPAMEGRGPGLRNASLTVRAGEIVGVAAVSGNGHRELMLAAAGLLTPTAGSIEARGTVALVPEDRTTEGLIPGLSVAENVALGFGAEAPWVRGIWLDWAGVRREAATLVPAFEIMTPGLDALAATLSGGNQQKLVLARAMARQPDLLVVENPTRGLDIRAAGAIGARLEAAAREGVAILLHSSDLDEVLALADRVVVVCAGHLRDLPTTATRDEVGAAMLGVAEGDE